MEFSPEELQRYQRHLSLKGFGIDAQERLKRSSVLVIGCGGLGCPALLYMAAAGVGRIVIVDDDVVDLSNLQRQVLFSTAEAGQRKAIAAAARLRQLNPFITIEPHVKRFTRTNALDYVRGVDLVLDGSDNFATRYLVNDACVLGGKPFVFGAISAFAGQVSVFNWKDGPTYRCLFPEPPEPGTVPNCAEGGVLGVLPGLVGTAQANEAIKVLAGIGEPLSGRLWLIDALTMQTRMVKVAPDPASRAITELPPEDYGMTCAVPAPTPDEIGVDELRALMPGVRLLDVREPWERALKEISPSAHVPLGQLAAADLETLLGNDVAGTPLVVYCESGIRSARAVSALKQRGVVDARSLRGGIRAWVRATETV